MKIRARFWYLLPALCVSAFGAIAARAATPTAPHQEAMDRDLLEVTIPQLEAMYRSHKYTVTEVVQWYMARIAKYNGIYREPWRQQHARTPRLPRVAATTSVDRCGASLL